MRASATATVEVTLNNVSPQANPLPNSIVDEGQPLTLSATATDPGAADILTYAWDFDYDGSSFSPDATGAQVSTTYPDGPATLTIALRVSDDDGGLSPIVTAQVTVNNLPPAANPGGPYSTIAGQPVTLSGSGDDRGTDNLSYSWDLDNDGSFEVKNQQQVTHVWPAAGTYTVVLQVDDGDGGITTARTTVEVGAAAAPPEPPVEPGAAATPPEPAAEPGEAAPPEPAADTNSE